ncbi:MAG: hypothetical protein Q8P18_00250 [Pseudomonadota bacterium]|nr:hypothetical protein [Pseudomonadota bacterium]
MQQPTASGQNEQQPGGIWEEFGQPGQGTQPAQPGVPAEPGQVGQATPQPSDATPEVGELATTIETIRGAQQLENDDAATALRNVASGLEQMAGAEKAAENIARIRGYADQILASDPASPEQGNLARSAMEESLTALQNIATDRGIQDFDPQVQNMRTRMEALQADQPLTAQVDAFANSLQQIVDAMNYINQRPATGTQ